MTANRRIFLNIIATYGRSLYALVIGLFCGRWTLMTLGEVDYGLMGVVGGLTAFVTFLNGIMAGGIGRFYAISVGAVQKDPERGLEECHRWFTTAVVVHTVLPTILMMIGYPIGEWAVRHFLTIPPDRIQSCVWVWRCVCVSTFVGMVGVPFSAWYGAKQEIAELTIYSFVTTTLNVCFMYYAVHHPGDWMVSLACWTMVLSVIPQLIICSRAGLKYPECRFMFKYIATCWCQIKQMVSYSACLLFGALADLLGNQGIVVLINKFFGPRVNAAMQVGNTLSSHCTTLSGSVTGAFGPAVMNSYGAGNYDLMRSLTMKTCKYSSMLILVFAIPMVVECQSVLRLWLKSPPHYASGFCILSLIAIVIDQTTRGCSAPIHAVGKIALYQFTVGGCFLLTLPMAMVIYKLSGSVYCAAIALIVARFFGTFLRVLFAIRIIGFDWKAWLFRGTFPLVIISSIGLLAGMAVKSLMSESILRIGVVVIGVEFLMLPLAWLMLVDPLEKIFLMQKLRVLFGRS